MKFGLYRPEDRYDEDQTRQNNLAEGDYYYNVTTTLTLCSKIPDTAR